VFEIALAHSDIWRDVFRATGCGIAFVAIL
jgi:hypothetical protein